MSFNRDELVAPDFINNNFLKEVLEFNGDLKNVTIHAFETSPATTLGDHFASIMFRAHVTYSTERSKNQKCSLIIKTLPVEEGLKKDLLTNSKLDLFGTEIFMYTKVLSDCAEVLYRAGYKDKLAPKILYHSTVPRKVLVFEDLKPLGYIMFPRHLPNQDDGKVIFSKLGQFHAATFKMANEGREDIKLKGSIFNMSMADSFIMFEVGISHFCEMVSKIPGLEAAADKLGKITYDKLLRRCKQSMFSKNSYNVLNHADYHIRNMMFKVNSEDIVTESVLLDFQICHWGTPAYDLYYMSAIIPRDRRQDLYKVYFDTFIDVLVKAGYKGTLPTYELLQKELKKYRLFDFFFLATISAFLITEQTEVTEQLEDILQSKELIRVYYRSPNYMSFVKDLLPSLVEDGVLDDIIQMDDKQC